MPSFWVEKEDVEADQLVLRGDEAHHLYRVRRQQVGDIIDVVDGEGHFFRVRLAEIGRSEVVGDIVERCQERGERDVRLFLAPALLKGQRFDGIVEKATEVGVVAIWPIYTERGIVRGKSESKIDRWQRLARAATKQCSRSRCPELLVPEAFDRVVERLLSECDAVFMGALGGQMLSLLSLDICDEAKTIGLLIGPEGGFSPAEISRAQYMGVCCFSWGASTLRADTASVVLAALLLNECERRAAHGQRGDHGN
ncbi:MAG: RsmE family RNA methyltransferase [Candidatus Latescibacterota bacterium]|jgi:16S rRNA (uracil1498-N3)-methyltransferase|tara:strand:+ start:185 stop:946 length:762 start_codon:yes stop_codon:yes gene_type:complete